MKNLYAILLVVFSFFAATTQLSAANESVIINKSNLLGEWVAQIDIPQNDLSFLLSFDFLDAENCIVSCKWIQKNDKIVEKTGKATYSLENNQLVIRFLNKDEHISYDHIFGMENVYTIRLKNDQLILVNSPQFRNIDVYFGKGYNNRGFSKIVFSHED